MTCTKSRRWDDLDPSLVHRLETIRWKRRRPETVLTTSTDALPAFPTFSDKVLLYSNSAEPIGREAAHDESRGSRPHWHSSPITPVPGTSWTKAEADKSPRNTLITKIIACFD